ncbi:YecA family protein [Thermoactinomyces sp. DSM 45892]|uniref:YecA family protein n=1 Tax=Thermoactinomyces sp. DSM 45892 TaxID=1882753 RepID=UPI0008961CB2|nr:SEC-C domain-containing protein [Thermoactinomyces sp. DSM 45892]SDY70618.1 SEC-C motif-containing protein [Thermoactinomyces sp. DSM 45892]
MVGRNEPCPCGSGKKYKKCCERVVTIRHAEGLREGRDRDLSKKLLADLNQWFHPYWKMEKQSKWGHRFKELLHLPLQEPVPQSFSFSFHYWLLLDAPCVQNKRPVELWASTVRRTPEKERVLTSYLDSKLTCYEMIDVREDSMLFRSLLDGVEYEVIRGEEVPRERIVFTRLIRLGNRYELFGPYTSFVHEMRGEILVQLEKFNHLDQEQQKYATREQGWQVLGWSMKRAQELEKAEKLAPASTPEMVDSIRETLFWPNVEYTSEQSGLPIKIMQQLEQFYVSQVNPLQKRTQQFYSKSLEVLFDYLSKRFGQSFQWSMLNEEAFIHFFSIWYLDSGKATPMASKIFLNTLKNLFQWLYNQGISNIYLHFKKVYSILIHKLPTTIEARTWLAEHAIDTEETDHTGTMIQNMFMLGISGTGPVLLIGERWVPVQLRAFPAIWSDERFWIRGTIQMSGNHCIFTHIENVYPMTLMEEELPNAHVLGQK